jgi:predicted nuclease of predicted toxin-antitoxin system
VLLIDENLSYKLAAMLQSDFPGACAVGRVLGDGTPDKEVWAYAQTNGLAVLTKDKDFVEYWKRMVRRPRSCSWTSATAGWPPSMRESFRTARGSSASSELNMEACS